MKPDWKDAPDWANWVAMDEDGAWYWYENEPSDRDCCFSSGDGKYERIYFCDWKCSLEQKPEV